MLVTPSSTLLIACGSPVKDMTKDSTEEAPMISMTNNASDCGCRRDTGTGDGTEHRVSRDICAQRSRLPSERRRSARMRNIRASEAGAPERSGLRVGRYHAASDDHNEYAQRYYENFDPDLCAQRILLCKSVGNKSDGDVLLLSVRVGHAEHCQPDQRVAQKSSAIGLQASINAVLSISRYTCTPCSCASPIASSIMLL